MKKEKEQAEAYMKICGHSFAPAACCEPSFFLNERAQDSAYFIDKEETKSTTGSPGEKSRGDHSRTKRDAKHLAPAAMQRETSALTYLQQKEQGTISGRKYGCSSPSKSPS
jgi:hypothetical protein